MAPREIESKEKLATLGQKRAYVTYLAGGGDYVKGVVGLAKGLRKVQSEYPLVVATLNDVPEEHRGIMRSHGCIVREIDPISPPDGTVEFALPYFWINYSKLRIWNFVEYGKMIYLDADVQVFENIDHLFDTEDGYIYGAMECFCNNAWSGTPQHKVGYCQQQPNRVPWPADMGSPPLYFNAGMLVFEPCHETYTRLLETLRVTPPTPLAEQDFLNMFFKDNYRPIPNEYNFLVFLLWWHPEKYNKVEGLKVVHYCSNGSKPWRYTGLEPNMDRDDIKTLVGKWWDIYNDNDNALDFESKGSVPHATVEVATEHDKLYSKPEEYSLTPELLTASSLLSSASECAVPEAQLNC